MKDLGETSTLGLEDLNGVGSATATKLKAGGFSTIESVAVTPARELVELTGIGLQTASKISQTARSILRADFSTAAELLESKRALKRITSGTESLDNLLGGGFETQAITELVGEYGAGKSQICMKLSVIVQLPKEKGGLESKALFIDTEGTFAPNRCYQIAEHNGLDPDQILENIIYARAYNSDHQILIVDRLYKVCREENVKLVILDSLISHFRGEYIGRENLPERQQKLNHHLHKLLRLAEIQNIAVVVTNQCQANPQAFFGNPNRPAGGHVIAHATTHRLFLRKSRGSTRIARVMDSPYLPEGEAVFQIDESGISDIE